MMKIEEFWDKYMNESILDIFDETCEFFSQKFSKKILEEYDVAELILETKGHHETAKEFDKVLSFIQLIKEKQPKLYKENFQYIDDTLVEYYCFMHKPAKVEEAFSNFIKHPVQDFDKYLGVFKLLIFYRHTKLIDIAITQNYNQIAKSKKLIGTAGYDLAMAKFYIALQDVADIYKTNGTFNKKEFCSTLENFGFELEPDYLQSVEKGICDSGFDNEFFISNFQKNRKASIEYLLGHYLKYMQTLGFSFVLSGRIWDKVYELWETNVNKNQKKPAPEKFFNIHPDKFDKFLAQLSGDMFIDNKPEMIATLWGSVYVYDFLKTASVIDETVYNAFIQATKKLKGIVIGQFMSDLWNYNFVHHWPKPKSISELEFTNEEKIFSKSFKFKERDFKEFKVLISDELENIGELSEYIIEGAKLVQKQPDFSNILDKISSTNIFDDDYSEQKNQKEIPPGTYIDPATLGNKVGRNDPCPCGSAKKYKKCCG